MYRSSHIQFWARHQVIENSVERVRSYSKFLFKKLADSDNPTLKVLPPPHFFLSFGLRDYNKSRSCQLGKPCKTSVSIYKDLIWTFHLYYRLRCSRDHHFGVGCCWAGRAQLIWYRKLRDLRAGRFSKQNANRATTKIVGKSQDNEKKKIK